MTDLDLTKLREIAEAATPGPWGFEPSGHSECGEPQCCFEYWDNRIWSEVLILAESVELSDDATHIAAFDPPTVLALIDEVERLGATLDDIKSIAKRSPGCDKYDDDSGGHCGWRSDLLGIKAILAGDSDE